MNKYTIVTVDAQISICYLSKFNINKNCSYGFVLDRNQYDTLEFRVKKVDRVSSVEEVRPA